MVNVEIIKQNSYFFLWINKYLWMWDIPVEQKAQKEISDQCHGDVLIAGYGLGILQKFLSENPNVSSITTIEILPEVVDAVSKAYGKLYGTIIYSDFYEYKSDRKFDCVVGDIWEDIASVALSQYNKFEGHAKKFLKPNGKVLAWGQEFFVALNYYNKHKNSLS